MEHLENQNHSNEEKAENMPHETVNANPDPSADDENIHARDGKTTSEKNESERAAETPASSRSDTSGEQAQKLPEIKKPRKPIRVSLGVLVVCILLTGLLVFQATFVSLSLENERKINEAFGLFSGLDKLTSVAELYEQFYLYDVDADLLDEALARMYILSSGDRYASYYTAEEWAASVSSSAGNSVGIGVYVVLSEFGDIEIAHVMSGSPAETAGIRKGDRIVAIDGRRVSEIGYEAAVNSVIGEIGSTVDIEAVRSGETLHFNVTRGTYTIETVISDIVEQDGEKYGYIRIIEFMQITVSQFENAVNSMMNSGVKGFIFDVRDNPGGDLDVICDILDFLLPEGPIVHILNADGEEEDVYQSDAKEIDLPMTVLVNGNTASAAELFTSALRDYEKAEIVGTLTFGKGCGQQGFALSDGSVVFITSFFYNPPFSENYDGVGITPDVTVELPETLQNVSLFLVESEEDTQLMAALDVLSSR